MSLISSEAWRSSLLPPLCAISGALNDGALVPSSQFRSELRSGNSACLLEETFSQGELDFEKFLLSLCGWLGNWNAITRETGSGKIETNGSRNKLLVIYDRVLWDFRSLRSPPTEVRKSWIIDRGQHIPDSGAKRGRTNLTGPGRDSERAWSAQSFDNEGVCGIMRLARERFTQIGCPSVVMWF